MPKRYARKLLRTFPRRDLVGACDKFNNLPSAPKAARLRRGINRSCRTPGRRISESATMKPIGRGTGRMFDKRGYVLAMSKGHPRANRDGYVWEHVLVAEQTLGRSLPPKAVVHHVDGNPANNSPENLLICESQAHHLLIHQRARALAACGNASARKCNICGSYERQWDIVLYRYHREGRIERTQSIHRECNRQHAAKYNKKHAA